MDLTRYLRLKWIFMEAVDRPADQRSDYLRRTCRGDLELQAEVERLLDSPGLDTLSAPDLFQRVMGDALAGDALAGEAGGDTGPAEGDLLGHYRVVEKIGEGGMGVVYRAVDTTLDREVAIKLMSVEWSANPEHLQRFRREAKIVAALDHPNIIVIHAIDEIGEVPFIVMELVRGQTLRALMRPTGLPRRQLLDFAIPIADALAAAHAGGVTHHDLKPENVMVTRDGRVKVLDFGIARRRGGAAGGADEEDVSRGRLVGTPAYMSPEQLRGDQADARSDVFAFGTLLYELASGERPFQGETLARLAQAFRKPPAPLVDGRGVPSAFEALVLRCLAPEPSQRPKTLAPVLDELLELRRDLEREAVRGLIARSQLTTDPGSPPVARPRAVAVLPLQNLSTDVEQEHFCAGLTEEIASELSRVPGLRVTQASRMGQASVGPLEMGRMLGVTALVDGSVRSSGDQVRISVRLVSVPSGATLWSSRFDRRGVDAFAVQDEVAAAVAKAFDVELSPGRRRDRGADPQAYSAYLRGRSFWARRYEDGLRRALACFSEALSLDPTMAEAHAGLADCYAILGHYGYMAPVDAYARAREGAERALDLAPDLAEAHSTVGWIQAFFDWRWEDAEASFERALKLDPNYATGWEWNGIRLLSRKRPAEALRSMREAWRLDPLSLMAGTILGWASHEAGEAEEGDRILTTVTGMDPRFVFAQNVQGAMMTIQGAAAAGVEILERAVALSGREGLALAFLGFAYGRAGRADDADAVVRELETARSGRYVSPYHVALPLAGAGRCGEALDRLEEAVDGRESFFASTHFSLLFDGVRDDSRFADLVERMGL
jgi:serine/threonine protein kinase/tetratricopeptide (TPR) repeat protein